LAKVGHQKWRFGYLGIPLGTYVAGEEILLDTAALDQADVLPHKQ